ncbi:MAG: Fur family transcriptional regulator [Patescibacteria group bacterium]
MKDTENIFAILRAKKMRLTKTRFAFVTLLSESPTPLSVSDILLILQTKGVVVDKTTVYREIERFIALGILEEVSLGDRKKYYELASEHHHHLICLECNRVEDIDIDESTLVQQEMKVNREKKFQILKHSLEFFGLCNKCCV